MAFPTVSVALEYEEITVRMNLATNRSANSAALHLFIFSLDANVAFSFFHNFCCLITFLISPKTNEMMVVIEYEWDMPLKYKSP